MIEKLVSIIVPVYNAELYIKRCIDSLINQTYKNLEIIIINDGSNDNSQHICSDYAKSDRRIKVFNKNNEGVSSARNLGISLANGEYIMFVDADDYLDIKAIEKLLSLSEKFDVDIVKMNYINFYNNIKTNLNKINFDKKIVNCVISDNKIINDIIAKTYFLNVIWGQLIKSSIIKGIEFNKNLIYGEDLLFNFQLLNSCTKIYISDYAGYYYFINDEGANQNYNYDKVLKKIENLIYIYSFIEQSYVEKKDIYCKFLIEINNNFKRLTLCNIKLHKFKSIIRKYLNNGFVTKTLNLIKLQNISSVNRFFINLLKKNYINLYIILCKYVYYPLFKMKKLK